jgi:uncharacterized protein (TIGR02246 family)
MTGLRLRQTLGIAVGAVLLVCGAKAAAQAADQEPLAEVRAQVQAYARAWNTHDASRVAEFYSPRADMIMGSGPTISGRAAIEEWWSRYFAAISEHRAGAFQVESVRLLSPDVALAEVSTLTRAGDGSDENLPARRARGTWVLRAQDGQWLISALRGLPAVGEARCAPGTDR